MSKKRIYLAGPMTGRPDLNYPAFNAEAARLRALGLHVENPAENPAQETWQDYMRQAVAQLVTCDAVALLPGWENSRGALIENGLAVSLGIPTVKAESLQARLPNPICWLCEGSGTFDATPCGCTEVQL
jgi:nucleoside 2-deoxyribosyltransferase